MIDKIFWNKYTKFITWAVLSLINVIIMGLLIVIIWICDSIISVCYKIVDIKSRLKDKIGG